MKLRLSGHSRSKQAAAPQALPPSAPLSLLVIQPTPFCNIHCDYCYLPDRLSKRTLSLETLQLIFRRLVDSPLLGPDLGVVWHAGEPLVRPISFYAAALDMIAAIIPRGCLVSHSIQTNGMLLNQEWCDFIKTRSVQVGVSIDGPAFIHDAHRRTRSGKGTHAAVMRGIEVLASNAIPFHVIAVLTSDSLDFPEEVFSFFVDNGIRSIAFNIEELEGEHTFSSLNQDPTSLRFRRFMQRFHELTQSAAVPVHVREFDRAYQRICTPAPARAGGHDAGALNHQVVPFGILTVDCDGNFSTFSPELLGHRSPEHGSFIFGNVRSSSYESIVDTRKFRRIYEEITAGVDRCRTSCEYFELCGGGAPANKYFEHGSFGVTDTLYCRYSIQVPIEIVLEAIERDLGLAGSADPLHQPRSSTHDTPNVQGL